MLFGNINVECLGLLFNLKPKEKGHIVRDYFRLVSVVVILLLAGCIQPGGDVEQGSAPQGDRMFKLVVSPQKLEVNKDGFVDTVVVGGDFYPKVSLVTVNDVPIAKLDGGGLITSISDCLREGNNSVNVSNYAENGLNCYVLETSLTWPEKGTCRLVCGATSSSKSTSLDFEIQQYGGSPSFEMLSEPEMTRAFAESEIHSFFQTIRSGDGEGFYGKISKWAECLTAREGTENFRETVAANRKANVDQVAEHGEDAELASFDVSIMSKGILVTGKPVIKIGQAKISRLTIVKLNGKLVFWRAK